MTVRTIRSLQSALLRWYEVHRRNLPWRQTRDPYRIWISEVMLQQTQVDQVIPYFHRFIERFPDLKTLAEAPLSTVYKIWEGLGYYRRAEYLHRAAGIILRDHDGKLPDEYDELRSLPGFGEYTAGAVMSIAFHQPYPAVDGNVVRVVSRWLRIDKDASNGSVRKELTERLRTLIPSDRASDFNQALMEIGSLICRPAAPLCNDCPVRRFCRAYRELPNPAVLPFKKKKKRKPHFIQTAAVIRNDKKFLLAQRPPGILLGRLWEFPGGKVIGKTSRRSACKNTIRDACGLKIEVSKPLFSIDHAFSHYSVTIHFFECRLTGGRLKLKDYTKAEWITAKSVKKFSLATAHRRALERLLLANDPKLGRRRIK